MAALAYTAAEVAQALGVSESHVYRMAKRGEGPPRLPFGGRLLFPKAALHRWLDEQAVCPTARDPRSAAGPRNCGQDPTEADKH